MKCPCKGCDKRELGCHSKCNEYKTWKAGIDERNLSRYKKSEYEYLPGRANKRNRI